MNFVRRTLGLWLFVLLVILAAPLLAAEYTGKVVGISDGDTLTLLVPDGTSYKQVKVRLAEIDTPRRSIPRFGLVASPGRTGIIHRNGGSPPR